jgi:hypothetical protein
MKKTVSIVVGVFILMILLANIPNIIAYTAFYSYDKNKEITTETRVVTFGEIFETLHQQRGLSQELRHSKKYRLIGDEVQKGLDEAATHEMFLENQSEIHSIKVELPITTYKDDEKTIEFISGKGKVLEVLENGQWKEFSGSLN